MPSLTDVVNRASGRGHPTPTLLRGHEGGVAFVSFLSNDQIISASDEDMTVRRWSLPDGRGNKVKDLMVCAVAISPNKRWLAFGGRDGRIRLLDLETPGGEVKKSVARHADVATSVAFSPDSCQLTSGARDGSMLVWSSMTLDRVAGPIKGHVDSVWCVCYSPDGTKVASCDRETVQIWDNTSANQRVGLTIAAKAWSLAWSWGDNSLFAGCIDGTIKRHNSDTGKQVASYKSHCDVVSSIALSHDAKFVATASLDKTVRLWEAVTFQQIGPTLAHDARVSSISISPDNGRLASGSRDSNVRVWNLRTIAPVLFSFFPLGPNRGLARNTIHMPWGKATRDPDSTPVHNYFRAAKARTRLRTSGSAGGPESSLPTPPNQTSHSVDIQSVLNVQRGGLSPTDGSGSSHTDDVSASSRHLASPISPALSGRLLSLSEDRDFINEIRSDPTHDLTGSIAPDGINLVSGGSHSDIYKGMLSMNGKAMQVAIKAIRNHTAHGNLQSKQRRLSREIDLWLKLDHKNVIPLLGVTDNYGNFPAMVYPWIDNGTLADYLDRRNHDLTTPSRFCIINDVALGLRYLHSKHIVHGNISGSNVLVYGSGRACIADFGLSAVLAEIEGSSSPLTHQPKAATRWAAPELLDFRAVTTGYEDVPKIFPTVQSDVYSFASIMLHVLSGKPPYDEYPHDEQVMAALSRGELPQRPTPTAAVSITDDQWDFMMQCWSVEAADRPRDSDAVSFVHEQLLDAVVASTGESTPRLRCGTGRDEDQVTTSSGGRRDGAQWTDVKVFLG